MKYLKNEIPTYAERHQLYKRLQLLKHYICLLFISFALGSSVVSRSLRHRYHDYNSSDRLKVHKKVQCTLIILKEHDHHHLVSIIGMYQNSVRVRVDFWYILTFKHSTEYDFYSVLVVFANLETPENPI